VYFTEYRWRITSESSEPIAEMSLHAPKVAVAFIKWNALFIILEKANRFWLHADVLAEKEWLMSFELRVGICYQQLS
jgi:hypothetical protein